MPENDTQLSEISEFLVGDYQVEPSALRVIGKQQVTRLEPRAMHLLVYFAHHAGRVISRAELEQHVWEGRIVGEDALTNSISKLRRALGDSARQPRIIETVPKTGYRLIARVSWPDKQAAIAEATGDVNTKSPGAKRHTFLWVMAAVFLTAAFAGWQFSRQYEPDVQSPVADEIDAEKPSIAIIPFENLSDKPQDYFANGITTNLITEMSKLSGVTVIARGSVFTYLDAPAETRQISRELNADYVVRGAVQRQQGRIRVNVQLIEAKTERALWADRYEGEMRELFKLQDQIASALVTAMHISLAPGEREIFSHYPTTSVAAYDLFLRGQEEYGHRTREANRSAREYFEQAIALDPQFARAAAGLALVHSRDAIDGWAASPQRSLERAAGYAEAAARINPAIPQIHFVAGQVALFRQEHSKAIAAAERAVKYAPNYADAYALLAWTLNYAGRPAEALAALQTARRLNPIVPASYHEIQGEIRFIEGKYTNAIDAFNATLLVNPSHMRARMWLIASLVESGKPEETQWQVDELLLTHPEFTLAKLDHAFPFQDASIRQQLMQNLKKAGLPE